MSRGHPATSFIIRHYGRHSSSPLTKSKHKPHSATESPFVVTTSRSSVIVVVAIHHSSPVNQRSLEHSSLVIVAIHHSSSS
ncbi:hypothetical protein Ddye_026677 [Dipteronia dyeriana]|uniref:Uncharacterized protein n=1 Tax=Dipteronia dyeriana TaxID=168575 RepID=A0AAD9WQM8_9ROSI|nr:hypothetical protein Ddye_026677 [Dipteronia dyeriana]